MMVHELMLMVAGQTGGTPADAAAVTPVSNATQIESVWDFIVKGGPVMVPIALCSLVALTVVFERFVSLRKSRVAPKGFAGGLKKTMQNAGPKAREAGVEYCKRDDRPIARVFLPAVQHMGESRETVERRVKDAGEREMTGLRKYIRVLSVIAAVSPLLGLLGTIFGMIAAFQTVAASGEALGKTELLAKGIYQAMITTAAGLLVAIPVVIFFHYLSAKADRLIGDIDRAVTDFVDETTPIGNRSSTWNGSMGSGSNHAAQAVEDAMTAASVGPRE